MKLRIITVLAFALLTATAATSPVQAEGAYVGGSYLDTETDFDSATGWKIFGGWNALKFFGIEGSYRDMGTFDNSATMNRSEFKALEVSGRGILNLSLVEIFGKVGWSRVDSKLSGTLTGDIGSGELIYGVGAALNLKKVGFRAEWESFDTAGKLDSFSLGAYFRF